MSTDDRVTKDDVDNLLEVFEKEQLQRLGALQAVQPLLLRTKRAGSGPLSQAAAVVGSRAGRGRGDPPGSYGVVDDGSLHSRFRP